MGSEYDFQRFVDDENLSVRTGNNLTFSLVFEQPDPPDDDAHVITAYTKLYPHDEDCVCLNPDNSTCHCNWNYELSTSSYSASKCIEEMLAKVSKVIRCEKCERCHLQYQDFQQCGSCFLQRVLERDMPTVSTCPVCYEDNKESSVKELSCKHLMCTWCYAKLPEPKKCPLCRALDIT